jgi:hypothetical protein
MPRGVDDKSLAKNANIHINNFAGLGRLLRGQDQPVHREGQAQNPVLNHVRPQDRQPINIGPALYLRGPDLLRSHCNSYLICAHNQTLPASAAAFEKQRGDGNEAGAGGTCGDAVGAASNVQAPLHYGCGSLPLPHASYLALVQHSLPQRQSILIYNK